MTATRYTSEPPTDISPDGHEIWDWAGSLAKESLRLDKMRTLRADIASLKHQCGSCGKWMKLGICPKERTEDGYSRGPSCASMKCNEFMMSSIYQEMLDAKESELAALAGPIPRPEE